MDVCKLWVQAQPITILATFYWTFQCQKELHCISEPLNKYNIGLPCLHITLLSVPNQILFAFFIIDSFDFLPLSLNSHSPACFSFSHLFLPLYFLSVDIRFLFVYFLSALGCKVLRDPLNGKVTISSTKTGGTAEYECNRGFQLLGDSTLICKSNGRWKGVVPVCEGREDKTPFT